MNIPWWQKKEKYYLWFFWNWKSTCFIHQTNKRVQNAISLQKYTYITGTNKATELCNLGKFCTRRTNSFCTRLFQQIISTFESVKSLNAIWRKEIALVPLSVETNQRVHGPSSTPLLLSRSYFSPLPLRLTVHQTWPTQNTFPITTTNTNIT